jgi:hypothetical protein
MWPRAPTLIKYRLQSHPCLLSSSLRSAYFVVLHSSALLASVSQRQVSSTKSILNLPYTDQSIMTRFGLCACTMTSAGIACHPGPAIHSSHSTTQPYSCPQRQTSGNPRCDSERNCASRPTFPGSMSVYSVCFTMFPQSWQLVEARFPHLLRLVKVGNMSMMLFTANFTTP